MPAYFLTWPKFYQSIKSLPFVRPLHSYHPNIRIDLYPHDTTKLEMNWEKMRSDMSQFAAGAFVLIDFEANAWADGADIINYKWGQTYGADVRPEIVAVFRTMLEVAQSTRPDCRFAFYNCPQFWLDLFERAKTGEREREIIAKLSEAYQPILAKTAALMPSFYYGKETSLSRQIDYIQTVIAEFRKYHPLLPIIPVVNPCFGCETELIPANEFAAILHATGAEDVIVWTIDNNFPSGVKLADGWITTLKAWEIGNAMRQKHATAMASSETVSYCKALAKTI